jgi:hypothetical protein
MLPRRSSKKDSPTKLAKRMKRRWRVVLLRNKGEILGEVEALDVASAKAAAVIQFELDDIQRNRIMVRELGRSSDRALAVLRNNTIAATKPAGPIKPAGTYSGDQPAFFFLPPPPIAARQRELTLLWLLCIQAVNC